MTRITTASLLTAAALIAGAGAARAADPVVHLAGRSRAQIHHDVVQAAQTACRQALRMDMFDDFGSQESCVGETVTATLQKIDATDGSDSFAEADSSPRP